MYTFSVCSVDICMCKCNFKRMSIQVQITTEECWWDSGLSCTCAITVRVGRDVYTVGHCGGNHLLDWVQSEDEVLDVYVEPGYMHKVPDVKL